MSSKKEKLEKQIVEIDEMLKSLGESLSELTQARIRTLDTLIDLEENGSDYEVSDSAIPVYPSKDFYGLADSSHD